MEVVEASSSAPEPRHESTSGQHDDDDGQDPNQKKAVVRKRTKTGCHTCRKRRIKCDEGKPICNNCIKSKRHCEYNQRVVFKNPYGAFEGSFGPTIYPPDSSDMTNQPQAHPGVAGSSAQGAFPAIAPRPPSYGPQQYVQQLPLPQQTASFDPSLYRPLPSGDRPPYNLLPNSFQYGTFPMQTNPLTPSEMALRAALPHHGAMPSTIGSRAEAAAPLHANLTSTRFIGGAEAFAQSGRLIQNQGRIWQEDDFAEDDASMAGSEEEDLDPSLPLPMARQMDMVGTQVRAFSTFAQNNMMSEYMHYPHAAELKDSGRRTVFMHFVNVTGPSMSLYERHTFDQAFSESPENKSIWGYTLPVLALNHPGLLNAMLAIGSLQISKLQGTPSTAALKHYHVALRRIARNLRTPSKRVHPATLAATLLLSYFEVWSSDHDKWCNHLFGARILFREIPLKEMAKKCLPMKRLKHRQAAYQTAGSSAPLFPGGFSHAKAPTDDHEVDFELLSAITGIRLSAEDYGLEENHIWSEADLSITEKDIEDFDNVRDLFWWYCKMDTYQSILGGTRLFMEFENWVQCPPRAPVNRPDTICGTYDHLILLLGRLASFASRDVARKRKLNKPPGSNSGAAPGTTTSPPLFPGMIPTQGIIEAPMGFSPPENSASQPGAEETEPFATAQAALKEWEDIRLAFEVLESHFGAAFQPLRPEYMDHRETPFGGVIQYRTYSVAGLWMNYYMGLIILHRSHPSMPPAAMQAAGLAACQTASYANQIGRIAAGLADDCSQVTQVGTLLGAALIESAFCLFVAGVQFQDDSQRRWIVQRMLDIARLTGWQSARQIADGCESCWSRAWKMGRGPPYEPIIIRPDAPSSVWQTSRRIDRMIHELRPAEERQLVLSKSERAHYALGLLGVEEDMNVLQLKDDE